MSKHWNSSHVMREFEKVAAEQGLITTNLNPDNKDFVGNPSKKTPVEGKRRYEPTKEYDVTKHDDLIDKAHPKTVEVANAMGAGGVVENIKEIQDVALDIATKMPNGSLHGIHAELIKNLAKEANRLEEEGKIKEAILIDNVLRKISLPFNSSHLIKEAWLGWAIPLLISVAPYAYSFMGRAKTPTGKGPRLPVGKTGKIMGLLGGATALLGGFGHKLLSRKETLSEDIKDLYELALKGASEAPILQKAADKLKPFLNLDMPFKDDGFKKFVTKFNELDPVMKEVELIITKAIVKIGPSRWFFSLTNNLEETLNDLKGTIKETKELIKKVENLGNKMDNTVKQTVSGIIPSKSNNIKSFQEIVFKLNKDKITGEMDYDTLIAGRKLEQQIDDALKELDPTKNRSVKGKIIKDDKLVTLADKVRELLDKIKLALENK